MDWVFATALFNLWFIEPFDKRGLGQVSLVKKAKPETGAECYFRDIKRSRLEAHTASFFPQTDRNSRQLSPGSFLLGRVRF